ncbi:MAG: hypothetical protein PHH51_00725 [Bacilli bacterium]|nr:hypothetical protein [Bacilli bacterium]MDD4407499.1 hypothetical protein [Bacilli bacterium]
MIKKRFKLIVIVMVIFSLGITYSVFQSSAILNIEDQNIAKFIFNTKQLDEINIPLLDIKPGENKKYLFSVANNENGNKSDVDFEYQIIIKTYHFVPLEINLYKEETIVGVCDETYSRNQNNELVCNMPVSSIDYITEKTDNYKLVINFPEEYDDSIYSGLVDYINLEIKSWQVIEE